MPSPSAPLRTFLFVVYYALCLGWLLLAVVCAQEADDSFPDECEGKGGCLSTIKVGNKTLKFYLGTNQSIYRFGDVVAGRGERWQKDRKSIREAQEFKGKVLERYFNSHPAWQQHEVDWKLLGSICEDFFGHVRPTEFLTLHFRNGDRVSEVQVQEVLDCAELHANKHDVKPGDNVPVKLVTIQHYGANADSGEFFATKETVKHGNDAAVQVIDGLQNIGFSVNVQSAPDPDVDFCTLVLSQELCLTDGGFDAVVRYSRLALGMPDVMSNFTDLRYFVWIPWEENNPHDQSTLNYSFYQVGPVVSGIGEGWKEARERIRTDDWYHWKLLQLYFNRQPVWFRHDVDILKFDSICRTFWKDDFFLPKESLVLFLNQDEGRGPLNVNRLLQCALDFSRDPKGQPLTARLVIIEYEDVNGTLPITVHNGLEKLGFSVVRERLDADDVVCKLVQANDLCLGQGGLDSVVQAVRNTAGNQTSQKNFAEMPGYDWDLWKRTTTFPTYNHTVYQLPDIVLYQFKWEALRAQIMAEDAFKPTLLRHYLSSRKTWNAEAKETDLKLLGQMCQEMWPLDPDLPKFAMFVNNPTQLEKLVECGNSYKSHTPTGELMVYWMGAKTFEERLHEYFGQEGYSRVETSPHRDRPDNLFCGLVQSPGVCLSQSRFSILVAGVRVALGLDTEFKNFHIPQGSIAKYIGQPSLSASGSAGKENESGSQINFFAETVFGVGAQWQQLRSTIRSDDAHKGTMLSKYFNAKPMWKQHETDLPALVKLCERMHPNAPSKASLTLHLRSDHNLNQVLTCASRFTRKNSGTLSAFVLGHQRDEAFNMLVKNLTASGFTTTDKILPHDDEQLFCALVGAQDLCMSSGALDSVVYYARESVQRRTSQINLGSDAKGISELGKHLFPTSQLRSYRYKFNDVLLGIGGEWEHTYKSIRDERVFNETLLQAYFRKNFKPQRHQVDWPLLHTLCRDRFSHLIPKEPLVVHLKNGEHLKHVLECAANFIETQGVLDHAVPVQLFGHSTPIVNGLTALGFEPGFTLSDKRVDEEFCTMLLAKDVCLSTGVFDSLIHAARQANGLICSQKNFQHDTSYIKFLEAHF